MRPLIVPLSRRRKATSNCRIRIAQYLRTFGGHVSVIFQDVPAPHIVVTREDGWYAGVVDHGVVELVELLFVLGVVG